MSVYENLFVQIALIAFLFIVMVEMTTKAVNTNNRLLDGIYSLVAFLMGLAILILVFTPPTGL